MAPRTIVSAGSELRGEIGGWRATLASQPAGSAELRRTLRPSRPERSRPRVARSYAVRAPLSKAASPTAGSKATQKRSAGCPAMRVHPVFAASLDRARCCPRALGRSWCLARALSPDGGVSRGTTKETAPKALNRAKRGKGSPNIETRARPNKSYAPSDPKNVKSISDQTLPKNKI